MGFRPPSPNFGSAARNPDQLENVLRDYHQRLQKVEKRTSTQSVSSKQRAPIASKPPFARLTVTAAQGKGRWQVSIRNPEFGNSAGTGQRTPKPVYHRLEYSADASFRSGVVSLEPSHQTFFPIIEDPNQTLHFRLASSYDGVNFNLPQYQQAEG